MTYRQTDRQAGRYTDRQTNIQADRQTYRQTDVFAHACHTAKLAIRQVGPQGQGKATHALSTRCVVDSATDVVRQRARCLRH